METELERLIVMLTGDGSAYMNMLKQAQASTKDVADSVKKSGEDIEKFGDRLKGFASTVVSTLSTIGLSIGIFSAFGKFNQYEEGVIRLNAAIEANGGNVRSATAQYLRFAEELERTTMLSKGQVMGMLRQAETMGMAGEAAQRTTRFAAGFAAALGEAPEHAMTLAIAMERGNVHMLRRIPALRGITNEQELLRKAQDLANQGMRISNELSQTAAGRLEKLKQGVGKLAKDVGGMVAEVLLPLISAAKSAVDWFNGLDSGVRRFVAAVLLGIAAVPVLASTWTYLNTVIGTVTSSFGILSTAMKALLFNPYVLALAAAILVVYSALKMVADAMGGWDKLWGAVKASAGSFWTWLKPTWDKIKEVGAAAWGAIRAAGLVAWSVIKAAISAAWFALQQVWETIKQLAAAVGLKSIGVDLDSIIDLLLKVEFGFTNLGKIATHVWLAVQFFAVRFYNDLMHFFQVQVPEVTSWFLNNWYAIWTDAVNFSVTVIGNLASNIVSVIGSIPGLISGAVRWDEVWRPLTEGFRSVLGGLPELSAREMTQLETRLLTEYRDLGDQINEEWEDFRRRRLEEIRREDLAAQASDDRDQSLTSAKKDRHLKLDAVLSGSAEALARAAEFTERMAEGRESRAAAGGSRAAVVPPVTPVLDLGAALRNVLGDGAAIWGRIDDAARDAWDAITVWALAKWEDIKLIAVDFWNGLPASVSSTWGGISTRVVEFARREWTRIREIAVDAFNRILPHLAGGAFGQGGVAERVSGVFGGGGGGGTQGAGDGVPLLRTISNTLQTLANRPDQILSNLGLPQIGS